MTRRAWEALADVGMLLALFLLLLLGWIFGVELEE